MSLKFYIKFDLLCNEYKMISILYFYLIKIVIEEFKNT